MSLKNTSVNMDFSAGKAPAWAWSVGTVVAYLGLYTAYNKNEKKLKLDDVVDVLAVRKGADHSAVQWNKVISLAGLTTLGISLSPVAMDFVENPYELMYISAGMLSVHSMYSVYKYYGTPNIPEVKSFASILDDAKSDLPKDQVALKRKISVLCGMASSLIVNAWLFEYYPMTTPSIISALGLSTMHFYLMEVDFKGALAVRPFGYLAFLVPLLSAAGLTYKYLFN